MSFPLQRLFSTLLTLSILLQFGCATRSSFEPDTVRQVSTLNALIDGAYESNVPVKRFTQNRSVGLGTPNHLNGEMIILDGDAYRVDVSGEVHEVKPSTSTPFAVSSPFEADRSVRLKEGQTFEDMKARADELLIKNHIQTVMLKGTFRNMKVRSVPRQSQPYKPLTEVIKNQRVFDYESVEGILVGFRFPGYMKRLNASGYHLHFLSENRDLGGHVLDFTIESAQLRLDNERRFRMILPDHQLFRDADLSSHQKEAVDAVEKQD